MSESPLHSYNFLADSDFRKDTSTRVSHCGRAATLQRAGVFRTVEIMGSPNILENLILASKKTPVRTIGPDFKIMHLTISSLGPEKCAMTVDEHNRIISTLKAAQAKCEKTGKAHRDGPKLAIMKDREWDDFARKTREHYERVKACYYKIPESERSQNLENMMRDALCLLKEIWHPNTRSNWASVKNGFHGNAHATIDNVFFPSYASAVVMWRARKQDRAGMKGKRNSAVKGEWIDGQQAIQPFIPVPHPEVDCSTTDPVYVGHEWSMYLDQPGRRQLEYLVVDEAGEPLACRKMNEDDTEFRDSRGFLHWKFSRYTDMIKRVSKEVSGKAWGISEIRPAQATRLLRNVPHTALDARLWIADACHHSVEESRKYGTHNVGIEDETELGVESESELGVASESDSS